MTPKNLRNMPRSLDKFEFVIACITIKAAKAPMAFLPGADSLRGTIKIFEKQLDGVFADSSLVCASALEADWKLSEI